MQYDELVIKEMKAIVKRPKYFFISPHRTAPQQPTNICLAKLKRVRGTQQSTELMREDEGKRLGNKKLQLITCVCTSKFGSVYHHRRSKDDDINKIS